MNINDCSLLSCIKNVKFLKKFSTVPTTIFATRHSCTLWGGFLNANMKYFNITDSTRARIGNVPTDKITGSKLIDLKEKKSCGVVYFNDGLHFIYLIRNNGVYIMTSSQKRKRIVEDPNFYTSQVMDGFLYFDFLSDTSLNVCAVGD